VFDADRIGLHPGQIVEYELRENVVKDPEQDGDRTINPPGPGSDLQVQDVAESIEIFLPGVQFGHSCPGGGLVVAGGAFALDERHLGPVVVGPVNLGQGGGGHGQGIHHHQGHQKGKASRERGAGY